MKTSIAKITKPQSSGVLFRERLFRLIDASPERPILWICGPAGSGKTTLAASYLNKRRQRCLWYRIDRGDADIATFFHYLGLAVKNTIPGRREPLPLFSPEYLPGISVFAKKYFEEFFSDLFLSVTAGAGKTEKQSFIVFDDYQEVPSEALLHHLLTIGLDHLPVGIRVIIISREEPPPQYARLRANKRVALLGWEDISFTRDESRKILPLQNLEKIPGYDMDRFVSRVQGWAAGLVLLNESLKRGGTDPPFLKESPTFEGIFDYFAEECFNRFENDIRDFLVATSFLPQMTPHNAGAIAQTSHATSILQDLNRRNCFTEKRALPHLTYQYHPLFRDFLLSRADSAFSEEKIRQLKRKAAGLLMAAGDIEDAVSLLMAAGDWAELLPMLSAHVPSFLAQSRGTIVQEWLQGLPGEVMADNFQLTYYLGLCRMPFNPIEAFGLFEKAFRAACQKNDDAWTLVAWSEAVNTILYGWNDCTILDDWIAWLEKRMAADAGMPSREIEAKVAISMAGALIFRRPDQPETLKSWLKRALSLAREIQDANLKAQLFCHALQYFSTLGDVANNDAVLYALKSMPALSITSPMAIITLKWMEAVSCNWCKADPDSALQIIESGLRFANGNGVHSGDHFLFSVGCYSALLKGDMEMASGFLHRMEELLDETRFHSFCNYNYVASLYHLLGGDIPLARQYAERALSVAIETGILFPVLFSRLAMAHILLESGDYEDAAGQLAEAESPIKNTGSGILEYSCLVARARLYLATGKEGKGLDFLRRGLQVAKKNGYTWFFWWWHPESMARLCACALEAGIEKKHVQKIIRTCNLTPKDPSSVPENWPFSLEISTMGRFEILRDGNPVLFAGKAPKKPLEMLRILIAFGGRDISEERISEVLWPDADGDAAHKSFEVNLVRLRKLLGGPKSINYQGGLVNIESTCCRIDALILGPVLQEAGQLWSLAERSPPGAEKEEYASKAVQKTERAIEMYKGDFLPADAHHAWTVSCRVRLKSRTIQLLKRLGAHWRAAGALEKALHTYLLGLEIDDLSEELYQNLMICRHDLGQRADVVTTFDRCRQVLSSGLGISPSAATESLYRKIIDR